MKKIVLTLSVLFALGVTAVSCSDDWDDNPQSASANDFVWRGLNQYYYWLTDSPDLADSRFANQNDYTQFLESFTSPIDLFNHLKVSNDIDRFSVIYSDYNQLEQALTGTAESNGMDYGLSYIPNSSTDIFGWVRYILPNTDASTKDIHRGDIFYAIDGVSLTVDNYSSLLGQTTYTLYLADIVNGQIVPNGNSISLTKGQYSENPVYLKTTFTVGNKKIGYLVYNGFYTAYENELNNAFAYFQAEGITHLILDLRYNSGGSVATATRLASMITGQFTGQIFAKQEWNYKMNDYLLDNDPEQLVNRFTNTIENGSAINSLNLSTVYILTSNRTASASELIINGLKSYINVVQIGDATVGKNVGSVTLYDSPTFRKVNVNPTHKYAMQPIVLKIANNDGFSDYTNGLTPNINYIEDLSNLGFLGETSDPFLNNALNYIDANGRFAVQNLQYPFRTFSDKKELQPFGSEMYLER